MKHTPGPWEATPGRKVIGRKVPGGYMDLICDLSESPWVDDIPYNSLLIAAAPDLLGACKIALPLLQEYREIVIKGEITGNLLQGDYEPTKALEKAILKAEGREP